MKKLGLIAMVAVFGVSVAFGASLSVPWYVDNADAAAGVPPTVRVTALVYLKSNVEDTLTLSIEYFNEDGAFLGPPAPNNTFTIAPNSALAFRPVAEDPNTRIESDGQGGYIPTTDPDGINDANAGGQEGLQGVVVPDRPRGDDLPGSDDGSGGLVSDSSKNGSITVTWQGEPTDVQGTVQQFQTTPDGKSFSFAYLLPPGA